MLVAVLTGGYFLYDKYNSRVFTDSPEGVVINFGKAASKGDMKKARSFCTGAGKIDAYMLITIYVAGDRLNLKTFKEDIKVLAIEEQERWGDTAIVHVRSLEKGEPKVKVVTTVKVDGKWLIDKIEK